MLSLRKALALVGSLIFLIGMAGCDKGEEQAEEDVQQQEQAEEGARVKKFERVKIQPTTIKEVDPDRGVVVASGMLGPKTDHWVTEDSEMTRGGEAIGIEDLEAGQKITFQISSGDERFEIVSLELLDDDADAADSSGAAAEDESSKAADEK